MKVLHLINGEFYSGAERVQDLLALNLPAFGYHVDFATLKRGRFAQSRHASDAKLFEVPMRSRLDLHAAWIVAQLLRAGEYQLLHTHTPRGAMIGRVAATLAHRPMVHHVHSPTSRDTETAWRNLTNTAIERWSLGSVRQLIAVSNSLRSHLEHEGFCHKLISVVPNGVPTHEQQIKWHVPTGPWVIGTVGLFRPRKGIEILIEALHRCLQRGLDVRLRAVGSFEEDGYRQAMLQLAQKLGVMDKIEWTGFTTDVRAELKLMNIFALPSLYGEGLPMALIEAMAAGLPVVATAVEGTPEVLTPLGAGLLIEPANAGQLADAIASLVALGPRAREVAEAGRRRQIERYSDKVMARAVADVYNHVLMSHAIIDRADPKTS